MSGIYGFTCKPDPCTEAIAARRLRVWNRRYGKDGSGEKNGSGWALGCHLERLGSHPLPVAPILEQEGLVFAADALLYNRPELLARLELAADAPISDEQLLLNWILRFGYPALREVNGDFSGAVYQNGKWILFRDHLGVRPLYYYLDEHTFAFSTELRGLAALPGADLAYNEKKLYLSGIASNDLSETETDFANIQCIRPASFCEIQPKKTGFTLHEEKYWEMAQQKIRYATDAEYQAEMRRLVTDAIDIRARAVPQPLGGELSGGLDSSVIAILMNRLGYDSRFICWSLPFEEIPMQPRDERAVVEDVCTQEGFSCSYLSSDSRRVSLPAQLDSLTIPLADPHLIAATAAALRKQGVRGIFSGQGGDEGVSHRCSPMELWYHGERKDFWKETYAATAGKKLRLLRTAKHGASMLFRQLPQKLKGYQAPARSLETWLQPEFLKKMKSTPLPLFYFGFDPKQDILHGGARYRLDTVAVHGAEQGVRYFFPFLDYRVLDYALSIPRRLYLHGGIQRYIYRQAFDDLMPQSLRDVHYKDLPSYNGMEQKPVSNTDRTKRISEVLSALDPARWEKYFSMNEVQAFLLRPLDSLIGDERTRSSMLFVQMFNCALIQNIQDNAARWADAHEND